MKRLLTTEQTISLIQLGVDPSKAFTLDDLLEVLPKEIGVKGEVADLCFDWDSGVKRWCADYAWLSEENTSLEKELIDALYGLACWYYGEYLKQDADKT